MLATVGLPIALGVVMLGLGLTLSLADFGRVVRHPRAVLVGLTCQVVLLPIACFGIVLAFDLPPVLAVGMMLLAASPGGTTANLFSHLAHGDVALNITLTAINSVLAILTMPLIVNAAIGHFMSADIAVPLQFGKVIQVVAIVLVPVAIGMAIRAQRPAVAAALDKPVRIFSAVMLAAIIVIALIQNWAMFSGHLGTVAPAALAFNLASLGVGYLVPRLVRLPRKQAVAIGMEIGIHNSTLAIALAMSPTLLNNPTMAVPPAIYGILMFFTAAAFGWWIGRGLRADTAPSTPAP